MAEQVFSIPDVGGEVSAISLSLSKSSCHRLPAQLANATKSRRAATIETGLTGCPLVWFKLASDGVTRRAMRELNSANVKCVMMSEGRAERC